MQAFLFSLGEGYMASNNHQEMTDHFEFGILQEYQDSLSNFGISDLRHLRELIAHLLRLR